MTDDLFDKIDKYKEDHMRDGPDGSSADNDIFGKSFFNFEKAQFSYNKSMQEQKKEPSELDLEFNKTMEKARERAKHAPKKIDRRLQARRELNSRIVHKGNSVMQMTELDASQLSDLVSVLHPLNSDALKITNDLDHDLTDLYDDDHNKYKDMIKRGELVLNDFDRRAKKYNVETPKRNITKRLDDAVHQKINNLPDFGDSNSVSLDDSYSGTI